MLGQEFRKSEIEMDQILEECLGVSEMVAPESEEEKEEKRVQFQAIYRSPHRRDLRSLQSSSFKYYYAEESDFMLGEGSYGRIYVCYYQQPSGRLHKLALKIISIPSSIEEINKIGDRVATTRQEIKALIQLRDNPNIIKIEDVIGDIENGRIYLILQFCRDKDLDSYIQGLYEKKEITSQDDVLHYFKQILNAFKDLVRLNIIHRDIKPENILVHEGVLKVADFGLSRQLFEKREEFYEEHIGTFVTASPQIRFKEKYTSKCDIYSLGITLYWMLYQTIPYQQVIDQEEYIKQQLPFDQAGPLKVSSELVDLLRRMLAYHESERIEWEELFAHPLMRQDKTSRSEATIRGTIGRDLGSKYTQNIIPKEFYMYIMDRSANMDSNTINSLNFEDDETYKPFIPILRQVMNQQFKIYFLKEVMKETEQMALSPKSKHKIEFALMRDLVRMGLEKFVLHLMHQVKDELEGNVLYYSILDAEVMKQLQEVKEAHNFSKNYRLEVEGYEKSMKKPKLSEEERERLGRRCQEYRIAQTFECILGQGGVRSLEALADELQRCFIEIVYFVKEEVNYLRQKGMRLPEEEKRYRELIILVHHFNMVVLFDRVFPEKYREDVDYNTAHFWQQEQFLDERAFFSLAQGITDIIDRFET